MRSKIFKILCIFSYCALSEALEHDQNVEARGNKKRHPEDYSYSEDHHTHSHELYLYFAGLLIKKIFILKLVYAFVLWCVIHKAGYFLGWFVSFLKDKKKHHHEHYEHVPHYDHGSHYGHYYDRNGPYRRQTWGNRAF